MSIRFALSLVLAAAAAAPLNAAPPVPGAESGEALSGPMQQAAEGVAAVLLKKRPAEEVFSPQFLAAVPPSKLAELIEQIAAQFGPFEGLEGVTPTGPASGVIALRFGRAVYSGPMSIGADGKVANLLLNDYRAIGDGVTAIERDLAALPGETTVLYGPLDGSAPVLSVNAGRPLALGSTFKLYVLAALAHEVERGVRHWDDVVRLDDVRSLPTGQTQDWPRNAPVTLHTLATMMISISDNTATDQLIHLLGRETVAEEVRKSGHSAPDRILPFLTTRELFTLKADPASGAQYAAQTEDRQAVALEALAQQIGRDPAKVAMPTFTAPTLIDSVEWLASAEDLRRLLAEIAELKDPAAREIMAVSPSMAAPRRKAWSYVGFKGGSEPGVLNLTWLLQKPDGRWWMLAMGWNDAAKPVETAQFEMLAQRILALP